MFFVNWKSHSCTVSQLCYLYDGIAYTWKKGQLKEAQESIPDGGGQLKEAHESIPDGGGQLKEAHEIIPDGGGQLKEAQESIPDGGGPCGYKTRSIKPSSWSTSNHLWRPQSPCYMTLYIQQWNPGIIINTL